MYYMLTIRIIFLLNRYFHKKLIPLFQNSYWSKVFKSENISIFYKFVIYLRISKLDFYKVASFYEYNYFWIVTYKIKNIKMSILTLSWSLK